MLFSNALTAQSSDFFMYFTFRNCPPNRSLARLGSTLVVATLFVNCTAEEQGPLPDTGAGLSDDSGARWMTRGQGLSDGSGAAEVFYCDPAGTNARFHWQLEGSGAEPEPDCDGSGANCPIVTNHDADFESTGRLGGCRTFAGAAWIDMGDAANAHGSPGSISLWFKRGDTAASQFIAGRIEAVEPYRGWMLALDAMLLG